MLTRAQVKVHLLSISCDCHVIVLCLVVGSRGEDNKDGLSSVIQGYMEQIEELK